MSRTIAFLALALALLAGCGSQSPSYQVNTRGGAVILHQGRSGSADQPEIIEAQILPQRGMNIFQVRAWLPGRGEVDLFEAPPLDRLSSVMHADPAADPFGNDSFRCCGAILLPFANRIRGRLSEDGKTITTDIAGHTLTLPANFHGKNPGAEVHSMHGLINRLPFGSLRMAHGLNDATVSGTLDAGNFGGHWPSSTRVDVTAAVKSGTFSFTVTATNTGKEALPMGIGWHPYFRIPSGKREQARLRIPAQRRAVVNNYDDVFPTGQIVPVAGSAYDFSAPAGAALGQQFLDDCFVTLEKDPLGKAVAEIIDPAARYGLRIISTSPEITAYQVYAPVDKPFIVVEPQFNWGDPFSRIWGNNRTGIVTLQPGQHVSYTVQLELFKP